MDRPSLRRRPEIEQDYEQMKSGWQLQKLSSTRYSEIVFYVLTVVLSYSLYHLFANTQAGVRFADKTRQAIAFEQLRTHRTHIIVYAGGYFEIFETLSFVQMVLHLSCAGATAHVAGSSSQESPSGNNLRNGEGEVSILVERNRGRAMRLDILAIRAKRHRLVSSASSTIILPRRAWGSRAASAREP